MPVHLSHRWPSLVRRLPALCLVLTASACAANPTPGSVAAPSPSELAALEAGVTRAPGDGARLLRLGAAYRAAGRLEDARATLQQATEADPSAPAPVLYLGLTYEDLGRPADARRLYERYIEAGPSGRVKDRLRQRLMLLQRSQLLAEVRNTVQREDSLSATPPQPRTVAVFPFLYQREDEALRPLSRALAEMLTTDLAQTDRLTVLERLRVQMLLDEMRLAESALVAAGTGARTGRLLGAEHVVQGSIGGSSSGLQLQTAVVRTAEAPGSEHPVLTESDALDQLFDLEKRVAFGIYASMGIQLTPAERELVNRRPTQNVQALLAYGMGLEAEDAGRFEEAAQHFSRAAALDPGFTAAQQRAESSSEAAAAAQTTTQTLTLEAAGEVAPVVELQLVTVEMVAPSVERRDAASETLGSEGIAPKKTLLDVLIRRPAN